MQIKFSTGLKYGLAMAIIFGIALFLRIYFPYHNVFTNGWVNFQETDCWFQMRQVFSLAVHFPHRMLFDPYNIFPGGTPISSPPFFYLLLSFFAWIFGAGSPTQKVIETVGAYLPAILGALVTVPVYFIGRELFNKRAGLIGAGLIAILPGQFLWRSMLGFPDYHVAETLFSATAMMFLIMALKHSKEREISFQSLWHRDWKNLRRPLLYSLLGGIALGLYLLTWPGGGLFIFIIFAFAVIQFVMDHLRGNSTEYLCIALSVSFLIALFMVSASWNGYQMWNLQFAALLVGILAFLVLGVVSFLMSTRHMKSLWYPAALVVLGSIGAALFYLADPSLVRSILEKLSWLAPSAGLRTVSEMQGLSISTAWYQFTTCTYLALISLAIVAYLVIREGTSGKTLLLVWSLVVAVAAFSTNRFAYYFAINVAVLTAYLSWRVLEFAGLKESAAGIEVQEYSKDSRREKGGGKAKRGKKAKGRKEKARKRQQAASVTRYLSASNIYVSIALIVVFFLAFYPNIGLAIDRVGANTGVDNDWHESLVWLKGNTPDPFNNPEFYYELYQRPPNGGPYQYPESAYGVMSWWDYGYFITYIAQRIPNANPSQSGAPDAALFFTGQDEASASQILDRLGSKYVIIDHDMAMGKFYAMVIWANKSQSQFSEVFYQSTQTGMLQPVMLYYPAYYQSMCSRLYNFGGAAQVPSQIQAISWKLQEATDSSGKRIQVKVISGTRPFTSYDEAEDFVSANPGYVIGGTDPYSSPVPLAKLEHYTLVHRSPTTAVTRGNGTVSAVEVFEYSP